MLKKRKNIFIEATNEDSELRELKQVIQEGLPTEIGHVSNQLEHLENSFQNILTSCLK